MTLVDEVIRNHNIFIKSNNKNVNDQNYNFTIFLPEGQIKVDKPGSQIIRLKLHTMSVPYCWPQVNITNNSLNINDIFNNVSKTIVLPTGIYSYPQLCSVVNNGWGSSILNFDINQLKFIFSWKTIIKLTFFRYSYQTFGFTTNDQYIQGQTIISTQILNEKTLQNIYVNINNVIQTGTSTNFDNNNAITTKFKQSNILCQIPIDIEPWGTLYYKNLDFFLDLSLIQLNSLNISITDVDGNYLIDLPNFEMVLNVQIINKINTDTQYMVRSLRSLNESMGMIKMMKYLKNKASYSVK